MAAMVTVMRTLSTSLTDWRNVTLRLSWLPGTLVCATGFCERFWFCERTE